MDKDYIATYYWTLWEVWMDYDDNISPEMNEVHGALLDVMGRLKKIAEANGWDISDDGYLPG